MSSFSQERWDKLAEAEAPLYEGNYGAHAFTSVMYLGENAQYINDLWSHAENNIDTEELTVDKREDEIARRVAAALAVLAFGPEFLTDDGDSYAAYAAETPLALTSPRKDETPSPEGSG